jgi:hypothetical protein
MAIAQRRPQRTSLREDRMAIEAAVAQLAEELGDRAPRKSTLKRALNLFEASGMGRAWFIDALYRARAEVRERRPQNRMAYFFRLVEDELGLVPPETERADTATPEHPGASPLHGRQGFQPPPLALRPSG